jgi:hypothetical protein
MKQPRFLRKIEIRSKPKWKRRCCYAHEGETLCSRKGRQLEKQSTRDGTGWIESNAIREVKY